MKFFVYLITAILIFAISGLFFLKNPNGQAWLAVDDIVPSTFVIDKKIDSITDDVLAIYDDFTEEKSSKIEQGDQVKIYRWKDSKGNWTYSDKPKLSSESEQVFLDPNNIVTLPSLSVSTNNLLDEQEKEEKISPSPLTIPPSKVLDLYKDANNVQKLIDDRQKNISQAIKGNG